MTIAMFQSRGVMLAGEQMILSRPTTQVPTSELPAIIALHGHGGDAAQMIPYWIGSEHMRKLVEAGFQILSIDAGGPATFNNDVAMNAISKAYDWLATVNGMAGSKVGMIGWSMGGGNTLQWIKSNSDKVTCALLWAPLTDLDYHAGYPPTPSAEAQAAYGGNYVVNSVGHKIADEKATWRNKVPIRIVQGMSDTTVPPSKTQAFVTGVGDPKVTMEPVIGADHTSLLWLYGDDKVVDYFLTQGSDVGGPVVPATSPTLLLSSDSPKYQDLARTVAAVNNNDPVASWFDQAGTGHAQAATDAKRPLLKTAVLNGKDVLQFDKVDDYMESVIAPLSASTLFVVFRKMSAIDSNSRTIVGWSNASHSQRISTYATSTVISGSGGPGYGFYATEAVVPVSYSGDPTQWTIMCIQHTDAAHMTVRLNGGGPAMSCDPFDTITIGTLLMIAANNSGAGTFLDAQIAEIRRYSSALSLPQLDVVGDELAAKFALTWNDAA